MARKSAQKKRKKSAKREPSDFLARLREVASGFLLGEEVDEDTAARLQEIGGLALAGLSIWTLVSLATFYTPIDDPLAVGHNLGGQVGFYIAHWVFMAIGLAGYMLAILGIAWGFVLVTRKSVAFPALRMFGGLCFLVAISFLFDLGLAERTSNRLPYGAGGWLATVSNPELKAKFGDVGLWLLLGLISLLSFMLATEMAFYPALVSLREWVDEQREKRDEGFVRAALGWTKRLALGLWDFIRGAEIGASSIGGGKGAKKKSAASKKSGGRKAKKKAVDPTADLFAEDEEVDDEEEWEDEDEYEEEDDEEEEYEDDEEAELEDEEEWEDEEDEDDELDEVEPIRPAAKQKPAPKVSAAPVSIPEPPVPPPGPWKFPSLDLLEPPDARSAEDEAVIEAQAAKLEHALGSFRVEASVVGAKVGPTVTLFEVEVAQGTRMNKVTQLSSEIAAALRAKSVRIIAPIPGKATVGVEVPNSGNRRIVRLAELITQKAYDKKFASLPLFLGMDTEGVPTVEDLARMPHLLIAGTTGSGKSVCINTILASLLLTRSPHDVQLILVDPKMVELQMFSRVPHLMLPVVTDARQATNVLLWAVEKMEGRYELFKDAGVRNIKGYNALGEDKLREALGDNFNEERTPRHVPYMVIVVDEMADLMMVSKKEAEMAITRLAQKSRAVGIHVIVATQRPSTDVITGVLKGNLPTRIAFQVASKVDSRVILDAVGAEKLLGQGDMLYNPPQSSQIKRVQGALVEDHEIQNLVDFVCEESAPNFSQELVQAATGTAPAGAGQPSGADQDDLWDEAVRVILKSRRGSASLLQRALGVGYTRASRLIDLMTAEGIVGEHKGSKAREVLLTIEEWEDMHGAPIGAGDTDE